MKPSSDIDRFENTNPMVINLVGLVVVSFREGRAVRADDDGADGEHRADASHLGLRRRAMVCPMVRSMEWKTWRRSSATRHGQVGMRGGSSFRKAVT
jgi:hypothetical protein